MAESGPSKINLFDDFAGPEMPVAIAAAYGASAGFYLGPFSVKGDLAETDTGAVALAVPSGAVRISGNNENGKGAALTTELVFSPSLMGTLTLEARVQMVALTTRSLFIGFTDAIADDVAEPLTSTVVTHTLTASDLCGFVLDSQLTAATAWHAVYNGGATTGQTVSTSTTTGVIAVAAEWDVLRLEIDTNGTARYWINGKLESTVVGAVSTTVLQGMLVGAFGTAVAVSDMDVDYIHVTANRDWTV